MSGTSNYSPYAPNSQGFTEALVDLKDTLAGKTVYSVAGFEALAFENVTQGQPLYSRSSDGKVGIATSQGTVDQARVVGFAQTSKNTGENTRCITLGVLTTSGLDAGELYYLGVGAITKTAPSTDGHFITRVGEAITSASLAIKIEPPMEVG